MKDAKKPIEEVATYLDKQREAFVKLGTDAGLNKELVEKAYDDMIGANPKTLVTTIMAEGINDAKTKLDTYVGTLEQVNGYKAVAQIMGDDVVLGVKLADNYGKLEEFNKIVATATVGLDPTQADLTRQRIINDLINLAATNPTVLAQIDPRILDEERLRIIERLKELAGMKPTPEVKAETEDAKAQLLIVQGQLDTIRDSKPKPKVDADTETANSKVKTTQDALNALGWSTPKATVDANIDKALGQLGVVKETAKNTTATMSVVVNPDTSFFQKTLERLRTGGFANGGILDGNSVQQFANGGFFGQPVHRYASGGTENHTAQIARGATPYRVWAEPETGGEAYIPLAVSKRGRSTAILQQVAQQFGLKLTSAQTFADGGIVTSSRTGGGVSVSIGNYTTQSGDTPDDIARALMRRVKTAGVYSPMEGY
jgi:hypothetical protein